jgi:hypothetical protein
MATEGFEQEIPAIERLQAYASEHTVTGKSKVLEQTAENSNSKYFSVAFNTIENSVHLAAVYS